MIFAIILFALGSFPRVRESFHDGLPIPECFHLFPARAGVFPTVKGVSKTETTLSRACGSISGLRFYLRRSDRSFPRVREYFQ